MAEVNDYKKFTLMTRIHPSAVFFLSWILIVHKSISFCLFVHHHMSAQLLGTTARPPDEVPVPNLFPASLTVFFKTHCLAYTQKLVKLNISTLMIEAACTSEASAVSPTCTWCSNLRTELVSVINHCEGLQCLCICM